MENVRLVVFLLDDRCFGLHLDAVDRVLPAVDITPLPKAPEIVLGLINVKGKVTPVLDVRRRFRLEEREVGLQDHFIVARTSRRTVAYPGRFGEGGDGGPEPRGHRGEGTGTGTRLCPRRGKAQRWNAVDP